MLSLPKHLSRATKLNGVTKRERCFGKLSMTFCWFTSPTKKPQPAEAEALRNHYEDYSFVKSSVSITGAPREGLSFTNTR